MGMFAFKLTFLFCLLTIYHLAEPARILNNSGDSYINWLSLEDEDTPSQQSPPLSRRITPKSIFVAPEFSRCPEGHKEDQMGQCVKIVHVDVTAINLAKMNALLQKLNSMYAFQNVDVKETNNEEESTKSNESNTEIIVEQTIRKDDIDGSNSGPFHLSIPFNAANNSDSIFDEVNIRNETTSVLKNTYVSSTTTQNTITESTNELTSESATVDESSTLSWPEITLSTNYPEYYALDINNHSEFSTEILETTTFSDSTVIPESSVTEILSNIPPQRFYANSLYSSASTGSSTLETVPQEETTTPINTFYQYTKDILKIPIKFPESSEKKYANATTSIKNEIDANVSTNLQNRTFPFSHLGKLLASNVNNNLKTNENTKDLYDHEANNNNNYVVSDNYNNVNVSKDNDSSESSSIRSSNNVYISTSESSVSISNSKNDKYQKLPSAGRNKPKCDPTNNDCVLKFNVFTPDKMYSMNRNPLTTYIRFPGMYTKGTSLIRFPSNQKQPTDFDDVVSFAETNSGTRFWESNRYPTPYWAPWDTSKQHFVRIWPDSPLSTYNIANVNYNR
ncbi:hypothetical protein PGB90_007979 [Kerria lacca]